MVYLARKINRAKWNKRYGLSDGEISADGITIDLKTDNNALSAWQCHTSEDQDLDTVALALASGRNSVDRLDFVLLPDEELRDGGLTLTNTRGTTPVADLADLHVSITQLDYERLGVLARYIDAAVKENRFRIVPKKRVRELLVRAVNEGRVNLDAMDNRLREQVIQ